MKRLLSPDDVKTALNKVRSSGGELIAELFPDNGKQTVVREMWARDPEFDGPFWLFTYQHEVGDWKPVRLVYEIEAPPKQVTITEAEFAKAWDEHVFAGAAGALGNVGNATNSMSFKAFKAALFTGKK